MTQNYEHYISKNIKLFYQKRLFAPIIFLVLLIVLWMVFPLFQMLKPYSVKEDEHLWKLYKDDQVYCKIPLENLHFTGYTKQLGSNTNGYYYYCVHNGDCVIILLSPKTCEEGLPVIEQLTVTGKLVEGRDSLSTLYDALAKDLNWTTEGITKELPNFYLSEPNYSIFLRVLLFPLYFGLGIYCFISVVLYLLYIRFPFLTPVISNLMVYGNPKKLLEQAEEELATLPQLATEDMFITENFFIMSSPNGNALVPIKEILWIYKYSTLHKILWYHFSISYTLHINARKHVFIHSPKNAKSDIDGIMDYLAEANHNILVGFNEKNRVAVQEMQGKPLHIEKLYALFTTPKH